MARNAGYRPIWFVFFICSIAGYWFGIATAQNANTKQALFAIFAIRTRSVQGAIINATVHQNGSILPVTMAEIPAIEKIGKTNRFVF